MYWCTLTNGISFGEHFNKLFKICKDMIDVIYCNKQSRKVKYINNTFASMMEDSNSVGRKKASAISVDKTSGLYYKEHSN